MRVIWANKANTKELKKGLQELVGNTCYNALLGRETPCPGCPTIKALASGGIEHAVIEQTDIKGFKGTSFWEDYAVPIKNESGDIINLIQISRNITHYKEADEALRESEEKFRLISEQALLAIGIIQDGQIQYANERYSKMTGYSLEEIYGWEPYGYAGTVYKDDLSFVMEQSRKKEAGDKDVVTNYRCRGLTKMKEIVWWEIYSKTITYHGRPADLFTLVDITDRVKSEKDRKALQAQLQRAEKMEAIGTLAGGVAHDFNNLLMAIQGRISMMLVNKEPADPDFEHLKGLEGHIESASDLTRQLLGFARGGKYEVKPTDMNELIKKQNRMFGRTKKEVAIQGKYEENLWSAAVDRGQLEQVILNLYVNAWQAMPGGGGLFLETKNVTLDENDVKPFSVEPGRYVKIAVTDTGVGMDRGTRERIFEPFFTTKERGGGTGLGLASVYGIIKIMVDSSMFIAKWVMGPPSISICLRQGKRARRRGRSVKERMK